MEGCRVYDDSHMTNILLKNERITCTSQVLDSLWCPDSSPSFIGSENCNEQFDGGFHRPEKKRRLTSEQVRFLEKSFEVENKLEPDRKIRLAKEICLHPRQVAIWFQNRRARYKSKLLEKEYDYLKASYDKLKSDYGTLYADNEKLKNEVHILSRKLFLRENGKPKPEPFDHLSSLDFEPKDRVSSPHNASDIVPTVSCKQEEASSSAKSDVYDSGSLLYADGNHSAAIEPADSSHVFEQVHSDFSQDEDDSVMHPSYMPDLDVECCDDLQPNSRNFGFPVQDQGTWFWQY